MGNSWEWRLRFWEALSRDETWLCGMWAESGGDTHQEESLWMRVNRECREHSECWEGQDEVRGDRHPLCYWAQIPTLLFPFGGWKVGIQGLFIPCSLSNSLCSQVWLWMLVPCLPFPDTGVQACTQSCMWCRGFNPGFYALSWSPELYWGHIFHFSVKERSLWAIQTSLELIFSSGRPWTWDPPTPCAQANGKTGLHHKDQQQILILRVLKGVKGQKLLNLEWNAVNPFREHSSGQQQTIGV